MFVVTIYNMETEEEFIELAKDHKELDDIVESMHNIYGDILHIDIKENEEEIKTKRYSERPLPLSSEEGDDVFVEDLPKWLMKDLSDLTRTK